MRPKIFMMMKNTTFQYITYLFLLLVIPISSCEDFLDEESITEQTTSTYYRTEQGFTDLVNSTYTPLRDLIRQRELVLLGTDLFTQVNFDNPTDVSNEYNLYDPSRFTPQSSELEESWIILYLMVNRANTAISRQENVDMDTDKLGALVGESKFLRALSYFYLVQLWGDVPMPLEETTSSNRNIQRIPAAEVYTQIISDLEDALATLPEKGSTEYGRATKGAARFLLSKVHLTRGWNFNNSLGGSSADFQKALEYADQVIANYPLANDFTDLFPKRAENPLEETFPAQNDQNDEIVFPVSFINDPVANLSDPQSPDGTVEGNDYHSVFGGNALDVAGSAGRTGDYNRNLNKYIATPAIFRFFDPDIDKRYEHYWVDVQYALKSQTDLEAFDGSTFDIEVGDTIIVFRPWNNPATVEEHGVDVAGGTKPYAVLNTDEIGRNLDNVPTFYNPQRLTPLMWKFWQPGLEYDDALGTFDFALFRSSEAYLIAAEAILMGATGGNLGIADNYYNTVLDRALGENAGEEPLRAENPEDVGSLAAVSYRANGNLDIDMILDERGRELFGEFSRWFDLKRTDKLLERAYRYNPYLAGSPFAGLEEYHLLRPIPQSEIDRTEPAIAQNPNY